MKRCRECGFPYWLSKFIRWNEDGTIAMKVNLDYRIVIIEADFLSHLFGRIEESLGLPISHLVFEAQRNAAVRTISSQLSKFPYGIGRLGFNRRITIRILCSLSTWLGQAYTQSLSYKPGKYGDALVRNPFNRDLMAAIILGAVEAMERKPYEHTWKKLGDDDVIRVQAAASRPEISQRLDIVYPETRPGRYHSPRCRACGTPRELAYMRWNVKEGTITDNRRGTRLAFLDGFVPTVVFREMEKELGDDIYPLIIQAEKEYTHRRMHELGISGGGSGVLPRRERESIYENALATLPLRGQGNPVNYRYGYDGLSVTVENPYNEHLLAGQMAALFEIAEGKDAEVEWHSPEPSSIVFTVRAKP